ncbi:Phospho-2-dehydro-3-deoxyheptonate aldolase [Geodia barretti]|uniref:Phospho-2-dehydro-3-deoxyheptonate aldolase n=1 Tax=Geodia barretti TaxID=519541 RepID=A0AA35S3Z2_GEOBA|nr:Phospho-2-dehydro-3-deoxyheptonate aldolase [Geodia barretti]
MVLILNQWATQQDMDHLTRLIEEKALEWALHPGEVRNQIHVLGDLTQETEAFWRTQPGVQQVYGLAKPYKLANKTHRKSNTQIPIGSQQLGSEDLVIFGGPCALESEEQGLASALMLRDLGLEIMRASAFKPRSSPYSFQGLGVDGLHILKRIRERTGVLVETEVMDVRDVETAAELVDVIRIGARNMQNFDLLKEAGLVQTPVILKRGMANTIREFLLATEYILQGNPNVILCERGIRSFETAYRNTLDVGAIAVLKQETHLPVIADPSHSAGNKTLVPALSLAAVAAGADGLLIEVHPDPSVALSDGDQSLYPHQFMNLMGDLRKDASYDIVVGAAALDGLPAFLGERYPQRRIAAIGDAEALRRHGDRLSAVLPERTLVLEVPSGEDSKSRAEKARLEDELLSRRLGRDTVIVGFGGGVVTDLAGFVAATYLRGVPFIAVPTTLLAAVDASVGGKTGINTAHGKNLVGVFRQPAAVFADTGFLRTLPEPEFLNGVAEALKMAATSDHRETATLTRFIAAAVRIKAAVVAADERESGLREVLNFGHTIGHGLEHATDYRLAHGAAVAIGMIAESRMARAAGFLEREAEDRLHTLIDAVGLPIRPPDEVERGRVLAALGGDKKARGGEPRFVMLEAIGRVRNRDGRGRAAYSFPLPAGVVDSGLAAIGL